MEQTSLTYTTRIRAPGIEQDTGFLTVEQEAHAAERIGRGLEAAKANATGIDASTARVIAACLHRGYGSHMEHFAATGTLDPDGVLRELDQLRDLNPQQTNWYTALWDFLERVDSADPDEPETEHQEPQPMVFVQVSDPELGPRPGGRWLHADVSSHELTEEIAKIYNQLPVDGSRIIVSATVGFHGLDIPTDADARDISRYASGIRDFGEAYARFCSHVGYPADDTAFTIRYKGSFDTRTDFVTHQLEQNHEFVSASPMPRTVATDTPEQALDHFEESLSRDWLILEGRHCVHVFSRRFELPTREEDL